VRAEGRRRRVRRWLARRVVDQLAAAGALDVGLDVVAVPAEPHGSPSLAVAARRFVAVVALRPGGGDQLVAEVARDRVPIALGRRSPAAGARRGQPDAVARPHRRAGEFARRALAEGLVHRAPVIASGGLELDRRLAALLAAMQAPGPDLLAVAKKAD